MPCEEVGPSTIKELMEELANIRTGEFKWKVVLDAGMGKSFGGGPPKRYDGAAGQSKRLDGEARAAAGKSGSAGGGSSGSSGGSGSGGGGGAGGSGYVQKCYNCGRAGHRASECKQPMQPKKCFTVKTGHIAANCPQTVQKGAPRVGNGDRRGEGTAGAVTSSAAVEDKHPPAGVCVTCSSEDGAVIGAVLIERRTSLPTITSQRRRRCTSPRRAGRRRAPSRAAASSLVGRAAVVRAAGVCLWGGRW
jgi:hypothetical protein